MSGNWPCISNFLVISIGNVNGLKIIIFWIIIGKLVTGYKIGLIKNKTDMENVTIWIKSLKKTLTEEIINEKLKIVKKNGIRNNGIKKVV